MMRPLLTFSAALSLTLCVATVVLQLCGIYTIGQVLGLRIGGLRNVGDSDPSAWMIWIDGFPLSVVTALSALLPILAISTVVNQFRARRLRQGRCTRCGYDLRATPARCPECGAPAEVAKLTA